MGETPNSAPAILRWWEKVPVLIRAILLGWLVMDAGVFSYGALVALNVKTSPQVPWAALVMLPLLWVYWKYLGGRWWPPATSTARQACLRGSRLSAEVWIWALLAGLAGVVFTLAFGSAYQRIVGVFMDARGMIPQAPGIPPWTLYPSLLMVAIVAGVCEEAGIRGYLQGMIERRHGPVAAILVSSLAFTYAHFGHDWGQALAVPFFVASLWYGTLTWITQSILPMIVIHISLDFYLFGQAMLFESTAQPRPLSETGLDNHFLLTGFTAAVSGVLLLLLLRKLRLVVENQSRLAPR